MSGERANGVACLVLAEELRHRMPRISADYRAMGMRLLGPPSNPCPPTSNTKWHPPRERA